MIESSSGLADVTASAAEALQREWVSAEGALLRHLTADAWARVGRLRLASPIYYRVLQKHPAWLAWLEEPRNVFTDYRYQALLDEWRDFARDSGEDLADDTVYLHVLRRWRRLMSLRCAYRRVNGLASEKTTVHELTWLAEFCVRECYFLALKHWTRVYGEPWDDGANQPARFCVLALGKLGGEELNFSSDIDLIFLYEGDGVCRREGVSTPFSTEEFFTKVAERLTQMLSAQTESGFLFRVDLRLRPEGTHGAVVRSTVSAESYYATAGQTWERIAWIKARPIAGALDLGGEFLEIMAAFRYPRFPPPSLLAEIASLKARAERELSAAEAAERNVKTGPGGIRDIEFLTQAFQLLHAGRYPFLQTHSTVSALEQLARYGIIAPGEAVFLAHAYWRLREIEHRLQMREEQQTHALPTAPAELDALAASLCFAAPPSFLQATEEIRRRVRELYDQLFALPGADEETEAWRSFFIGRAPSPIVENQLHRWFGDDPAAANGLRLFVCGNASRPITPEQVAGFRHLAAQLDSFMPDLARPLLVLQRLDRFAERYGSRSHFFRSAADHPQFLRLLALLFDRSTHFHAVLCAHPEIFEEVLRPESMRKRKTAVTIRAEMSAGPTESEAFGRWLRLYIRAEILRSAIRQLQGFATAVETEFAHAQLADATLSHLLELKGARGRILPVALGKYGGEELSFGSDLDVMFVGGDQDDIGELEPIVRAVLEFFYTDDPLGPVFALDLRLRPYGDAGPLVTTPSALCRYYADTARLWERQALTRARVIDGGLAQLSALAETLRRILDEIVYGAPLGPSDAAAIWTMRLRLQKAHAASTPPEKFFKAGPGGLLDIEFLVQRFQLTHGSAYPDLRTQSIRAALRALGAAKLISPGSAARLGENYDFIKNLERILRADENRPIVELPTEKRALAALARWTQLASGEIFWANWVDRLRETRRLVLDLLPTLQPTPHNVS